MKASIESAVFLNDYCHVQGGASRIAIDEAVALAAAGVDVTFLGATGPVGPELAESRVKVVCLGQPDLAAVSGRPSVLSQGLWNLTAAQRMRQILAGLDPIRTIVHVHGYTKSLTTSPIRATVQANFPIVVTLHDFFAICPNGTLYNFVEQQPCTLEPLSARCMTTNCDKRRYAHKLYRFVRTALQSWPGLLPRGVRHYIGLSNKSVELLRPHLPATSSIYSLDNIIDVEQQAPVDVGGNGALIYIGRLDPEKGIMLLLDAAHRAGISLTFIGDGPLRGAVESTGRHRVTGWQTARQVQDQVAQARCLVFPSQWYETFGLVVAECAARGVPAIVSDVSAAAERVRHGRTGLVFPSGDAAALAHCLRATTDWERMGQLGRNAYDAYWTSPSDRATHIDKLLDVYAAVLETPQHWALGVQ